MLATIYSLDNPAPPVRHFAREGAAQSLSVLEAHLRGRLALVGETFSVADAYLVWALLLLPRPRCGVSLAAYPALSAYQERHLQREAVKAMVAAELGEYKEAGWWTASQLTD